MTVAMSLLLDEFGLFSFETFQKSREDVILRQQREITELSTPVVKLWDGFSPFRSSARSTASARRS